MKLEPNLIINISPSFICLNKWKGKQFDHKEELKQVVADLRRVYVFISIGVKGVSIQKVSQETPLHVFKGQHAKIDFSVSVAVKDPQPKEAPYIYYTISSLVFNYYSELTCHSFTFAPQSPLKTPFIDRQFNMWMG